MKAMVAKKGRDEAARHGTTVFFVCEWGRAGRRGAAKNDLRLK